MVPIPQTSLPRPALRAPSRDRSSKSSGFFRQRRPLITYSRKDTRPLPLTANQFRRSDFYSIPADEDGQDDERAQSNGPSTEAGARAFLEAAIDDGSESGLSDKPDSDPPDDLNGSQQAAPIQRADASAVPPIVLSSTGMVQVSSAKAVNTPRPKQASPKDDVPAPKRAKRSLKARTPAQPTTAASRRLPVNELILVASPVDNTNFGPPQSSVLGIQRQDPINERTSSRIDRDVSPVDSADELGNEPALKKRPLSVFKQRLRSNKTRYKSVSDLRKKRSEQSAILSEANGDGFESGELYVSPLARRTVRRRRPRPGPLISGFGALQLQSGPLPDVVFEQASSPLKVESKSTPSPHGKHASASQKSIGRVSFSDPAREQAIVAELSSISAPRVPRPESDDSDNEEEDDDVDIDGEDVGTEMDEDQIVDGFQAVADDDVYEADTEVGEDLEAALRENAPEPDTGIPSDDVSARDEPAANLGVSLDFRRLTLGQRPRRRIRQDNLMEINEPIVEVLDSDSFSAPSIQLTMTGVPPPAHSAVPSPETPQPPRSQLKRPRSILKNASQAVLDSTTQAEHTLANTRRNSTVELSESRYFTDAADMLRHADPARHQIVPRRRSSYFDDVEMLDSEAVVPETSTPVDDAEMLDFTASNDLSVLKRASEAEWTSQSLPTVPRDLRTLTRSVSRGHGTLSQSVARRRPSMPFQSPSKIR